MDEELRILKLMKENCNSNLKKEDLYTFRLITNKYEELYFNGVKENMLDTFIQFTKNKREIKYVNLLDLLSYLKEVVEISESGFMNFKIKDVNIIKK